MKQYFINIEGENVGPLSLEELKERTFASETPVWRQDLPQWKQAKDFEELNGSYPSPTQQKKTPPPLSQPTKIYQPQAKQAILPAAHTNADVMFLVLLSIMAFQGIFWLLLNGVSLEDFTIINIANFVFGLAPLIMSILVKNSKLKLALILVSIIPLLFSIYYIYTRLSI